MAPTVIPSSLFLPIRSVGLGRFITNINQPQEAYHEPPIPLPEPIETEFFFCSQNQTDVNTQFGSALTSLLSVAFSRHGQSQIRIIPARGIRYSLDNSDAWFGEAVSLEETRRWIEKAALRGDKIYMIVGIQTLTDARIVQTSAKGRGAGGQVNVPVGLSLAAAGAIMPLADLIDPGVQGEHQHAERGQCWLIARGEQVCSLQYREVKAGWLSSRLNKTPQLSKTRQWLCLEGDKRDAYEDEETDEEEEEDMVEVDLRDEDKLEGEWAVEDCEEGAIYLHS